MIRQRNLSLQLDLFIKAAQVFNDEGLIIV